MLKTKINIVPADIVHSANGEVEHLKSNFLKDLEHQFTDLLSKKQVFFKKKRANCFLLQEKISGETEDLVEISYDDSADGEHLKIKTLSGYSELKLTEKVYPILESYLEKNDRKIQSLDCTYTVVQYEVKNNYTVKKDVRLEAAVDTFSEIIEILKEENL